MGGSEHLRKAGDEAALKEIEDMLAKADIDGDGKMNFEEFKKMVMES